MSADDWPSPLHEWVAEHGALAVDLVPVLRDTLASVWDDGYATGRDEWDEPRPTPTCRWPAAECLNPPLPQQKLCAIHRETAVALLNPA